MTMIAKCHLLTTTRRTDEGRGKKIICLFWRQKVRLYLLF
jgi:hypothetical protein